MMQTKIIIPEITEHITFLLSVCLLKIRPSSEMFQIQYTIPEFAQRISDRPVSVPAKILNWTLFEYKLQASTLEPTCLMIRGGVIGMLIWHPFTLTYNTQPWQFYTNSKQWNWILHWAGTYSKRQTEPEFKIKVFWDVAACNMVHM
jgi:hypothetical protein